MFDQIICPSVKKFRQMSTTILHKNLVITSLNMKGRRVKLSRRFIQFCKLMQFYNAEWYFTTCYNIILQTLLFYVCGHIPYYFANCCFTSVYNNVVKCRITEVSPDKCFNIEHKIHVGDQFPSLSKTLNTDLQTLFYKVYNILQHYFTHCAK